MIDLHCHVLPGIDDGPADLPTAVAMLRAYEADGVETVVATPHLRADFPEVRPEELAARCEGLEAAALAEGISLQVVPGGEVALNWALGASDAELHAVSLDGLGRDLLVETPPNPLGASVADGLFSLALRGYRLTLAHPELSTSFQKHPHKLAALADRGLLLQVTAAALSRSPRKSGSAALAHALVREGRCHLIAADAHSPGPWRPPELSRGALVAARLASPAHAEWLTVGVPDAILAGEPLPPPPAAPPTPRGLARLRRGAAV